MNTKTVKEKVIEIIESMYRTQAPYSEWADEIDRVYQKVIEETVDYYVNEASNAAYDAGREGR